MQLIPQLVPQLLPRPCQANALRLRKPRQPSQTARLLGIPIQLQQLRSRRSALLLGLCHGPFSRIHQQVRQRVHPHLRVLQNQLSIQSKWMLFLLQPHNKDHHAARLRNIHFQKHRLRIPRLLKTELGIQIIDKARELLTRPITFLAQVIPIRFRRDILLARQTIEVRSPRHRVLK